MNFKLSDFKVGQRITFKAAGKVAKLEGTAGKVIPATVTELRPGESNPIVVLSDHRREPGAAWYGLQSVLPLSQVRSIEPEVVPIKESCYDSAENTLPIE